MALKRYRNMLYEISKGEDGMFSYTIYSRDEPEPFEYSMAFETPEAAERDAKWIIDDVIDYVDVEDNW